MSAEDVESIKATIPALENVGEELEEKAEEAENIEAKAEEIQEAAQGIVSAGEVFDKLAEKLGVKRERAAEDEEEKKEEGKSKALPKTTEQPKRRYIGKSARINAELMREALRELKKAHARSYQPEVVDSIERAVRLLKVIVVENQDMFPGVIKEKE